MLYLQLHASEPSFVNIKIVVEWKRAMVNFMSMFNNWGNKLLDQEIENWQKTQGNNRILNCPLFILIIS